MPRTISVDSKLGGTAYNSDVWIYKLYAYTNDYLDDKQVHTVLVYVCM
jgi:hypothetical protein